VCLHFLLRSNISSHVSTNEAEDKQRREQDQSNSILQKLGLVLCALLSILGIILSNALAASKATEETYQIMYTVTLFFAWDFLLVQTVYGCVQAYLIMSLKSLPKKEPQGLVRILLNDDIYRLA